MVKIDGLTFTENWASVSREFYEQKKSWIDNMSDELSIIAGMVASDIAVRVQQFIDWTKKDTQESTTILCSDLEEILPYLWANSRNLVIEFQPDKEVLKTKRKKTRSHSRFPSVTETLEVSALVQKTIDDRWKMSDIEKQIKNLPHIDSTIMRLLIELVKSDIECKLIDISFLPRKLLKWHRDKQYKEIERIIKSRTI